MNIEEKILNACFEHQDLKYRNFQSKLIPTIDQATMIGVRTPILRKIAKAFQKDEDIPIFLESLPHTYFEENQIHSFIISDQKDYEDCIKNINIFLDYVDNWATCDQLSQKIFKKHKEEILREIDKWLESQQPYRVRFAIKMLMTHFLDKDYDVIFPKKVASVQLEDYYVRMMMAWYFAEGLAKQYDSFLNFIKDDCLEKWTHNKTIQKAIESRRISPEIKEYLKTLKK